MILTRSILPAGHSLLSLCRLFSVSSKTYCKNYEHIHSQTWIVWKAKNLLFVWKKKKKKKNGNENVTTIVPLFSNPGSAFCLHAVCILYCPPIYTLRINKTWTYFFFVKNIPVLSNRDQSYKTHPFKPDLKPLICDPLNSRSECTKYLQYILKILKSDYIENHSTESTATLVNN